MLGAARWDCAMAESHSGESCISNWQSALAIAHNQVVGQFERQNLTMRMSMRRFTRLTNAFSKKIDNHRHAVALYFFYYNFCRIYQTRRVTPAVEAGLITFGRWKTW